MRQLTRLKTSCLPLSCPDDRRSPPDTGQRLRPEVALPDPAVVELNPRSIRRINGALVSRVDPDPAVRCSHIGPRTVGVSGLGHKVQVLSVLGDEGRSAYITITAILDAPVSASEVDRLCRSAAGERGDSTNNNKWQPSHRDHSIATRLDWLNCVKTGSAFILKSLRAPVLLAWRIRASSPRMTLTDQRFTGGPFRDHKILTPWFVPGVLTQVLDRDARQVPENWFRLFRIILTS
jgi:hypothetical protein